MKFGFRIPSLTKRIAARTSLKRVVSHNLGFKAPKGFGWFTDPKKAGYNDLFCRYSATHSGGNCATFHDVNSAQKKECCSPKNRHYDCKVTVLVSYL